MKQELLNSTNSSSFTYSEDSDEEPRSLVSIDFTEEFALSRRESLKEQVNNYRVSIGGFRNSLEITDQHIKLIMTQAQQLENRISIKDSELNTLCSSIYTCTNELAENYHLRNSITEGSVKNLKIFYQQHLKAAHTSAMKLELNHIIKEHELIALNYYRKCMNKAEDLHISDMKLLIRMVESKKVLLLKGWDYLKTKEELSSLYGFVEESLKGFLKCRINDISIKFKKKLKEILVSEYRFWSLSQIFYEMKAKINEDYTLKINYIREATKRRINLKKYANESDLNRLKYEIEQACINKHIDYSSKPALIFSSKVLSSHLAQLNRRITKLHRYHRRSQKKITQNTRLLASAELKLAKLKSAYYLRDLQT